MQDFALFEGIIKIQYHSKSVGMPSKFRVPFVLKALNSMHLILSYQIGQQAISMKLS